MSYKSTISKTPLLIFDGNCQAHHLAAIFEGSGLCEAYCVGEDFGFVPSYRGAATAYCTSDEALAYVQQAKAAGRSVYQISQSTQMQAEADTNYKSLVNSVIKFPYLQYYCIAPEQFQNVYKRLPPPQRVLDFDLGLMKLCQDKSESKTDYVAFVRDKGRKSYLFNTESHPRGMLMSLLFRDVASDIDGLDSQDIADVAINLEQEEGINHTTVHPVAQNILDELGFNWGEDYRILKSVLISAAVCDWNTVIDVCEATSNTFTDTQMLMALGRAYIATGRLKEKGHIYKCLTDISPGFMHSWFLRNQYWQLIGDARELRECRSEMRSVLKNSRYYAQARAWMEIQSGNPEQGLAFARDYLDNTPDRADGIVAYAKILALLNRGDEAREIFYTFARNRGIDDFHNVISQLGSLEELDIDVEDLRASVAAS